MNNQQFLLLMLLCILFVCSVSNKENFISFAENKQFDNMRLERKPNNNLLYNKQPYNIQGHGVDFNNTRPGPVEYNNGPTLDGTKNTPGSMFMYSRNRCHLDCCPSTRSCDKGCVCETKAQNHFLSHRGNNNM